MSFNLNQQPKAQQQNAFNMGADVVEITYYTDPLCCWSWAIEPQWRRLQYEYRGHLQWRYCMGGLLPSWKHFNDATNSVSRPAQMGPIWMEATHISGMPIENKIWITNPPASSYLACIAVKCAALQSANAEERYLRLLREAVMLKGENIDKQSVLIKIAEALANENNSGFNLDTFAHHLKNDSGLELFRSNLNEVKHFNINRFPTLIFRRPQHPSLILSGYNHYTSFQKVMAQIAPDIPASAPAANTEDYINYWGSITAREVKEAVQNV